MTAGSRIAIRQDDLIAEVYRSSRAALCGYVYKCIGSRADAEDLVQEVFVRLLEYTTLLNETTVLRLVYSIARNRVVDYLRRHARSRAASDYFFVHARRASCDTEERVALSELLALEQDQLTRMSSRRSQVYALCVHDGCTVDETAGNLALSRRTVENHLFAARQQMRVALRACI